MIFSLGIQENPWRLLLQTPWYYYKNSKKTASIQSGSRNLLKSNVTINIKPSVHKALLH